VQVSPVPLPVVVSSSVPIVVSSSVPISVNTAAPYVAPTCAALPNAPCVQATGPYPWPTDANGNPIHTLYGSTGSQIIAGNVGSTSISGTNTGLFVKAFCTAYNGSLFDPCRKDPETQGPSWVDGGGGATNIACGAAANCSVATGNHRLASLLVTAVGTTGTVTCYDSTAASGTVIGGISASNGALLFYNVMFDRIAATGIYCVSATSGPAYTASYY
jgi:hypothetical protein